MTTKINVNDAIIYIYSHAEYELATVTKLNMTYLRCFVGLEETWRLLRELYNRNFDHICSRADFFALACTVTSDYAAELGELAGSKLRHLQSHTLG